MFENIWSSSFEANEELLAAVGSYQGCRHPIRPGQLILEKITQIQIPNGPEAEKVYFTGHS